MTRIDGHGPKPKIQFIDEWSELKAGLQWFRDATAYDTVGGLVDYIGIEFSPEYREAADRITHYLPMLMDAYAELWELMEGVIKAREQQEESKNDLYVPDAAEMVANARRTQR